MYLFFLSFNQVRILFTHVPLCLLICALSIEEPLLIGDFCLALAYGLHLGDLVEMFAGSPEFVLHP